MVDSDGLLCSIRQQDGSTVVMRYADNVNNRMFVDYVRRHEAYAQAQRIMPPEL